MDKKAQMYELVRQCRNSGLTRKAFSKKHSITEASFDYWCSKHGTEQKLLNNQPGFIEISSPPLPVAGEKVVRPQIELELSSGPRVEYLRKKTKKRTQGAYGATVSPTCS